MELLGKVEELPLIDRPDPGEREEEGEGREFKLALTALAGEAGRGLGTAGSDFGGAGLAITGVELGLFGVDALNVLLPAASPLAGKTGCSGAEATNEGALERRGEEEPEVVDEEEEGEDGFSAARVST